ncbi:MAG: arginine--tRNA ligase [Burkholderiaceae bacterium]
MFQTPKQAAAIALQSALTAVAAGADPDIPPPPPGLCLLEAEAILKSLVPTKQSSHGDLASGLALRLAKAWGVPPFRLAGAIARQLMDGRPGTPEAPESPEAANRPESSDSREAPVAPLLEKAEAAPPGFINLWLTAQAQGSILEPILRAPTAFGRSPAQADRQVLLEFVSANPTGPLHVGHGRQAALGDCIAALLEAQGAAVTREFYYNDAGAQIENLALSVQARMEGLSPEDPRFPADGYRGDYIADIAAAYMAGRTVVPADAPAVTARADPTDIDAVRAFAVAYLRCEQDEDLKAFGVRFDRFSLESALYREGHVADIVRRLRASGYAYEHEGALWLRSTDFGDDKDRVMQKQAGGYTYFVPDLAYHEQKFLRGVDRAINIQGSDHHGTIARVRAGLAALQAGIPADFPEYVLHKMVTVVRGGQEVKISKRAGSYVTLRDLISWSGDGDIARGRDAVRFFLISRKADTEFVFDIDLALSRSDENPVYYIQYAHARACSVLAQAGSARDRWETQAAWGRQDPVSFASAAVSLPNVALLVAPHEKALLMRLAQFPEVLSEAAEELSPHVLAYYLRDLAAEFHSFYNAQRVLVAQFDLRDARLALVTGTAAILREGLGLLGVSAPEQM